MRCKVRGISLAVEKFEVERYRKNADKVCFTLNDMTFDL